VSTRTKSPYLAEIERAVRGAPAAPAPESNERGAARAREQLATVEAGELSVADRPLYDALVSWRRDLARASAVPAYVIFDNKTLRSVAASRPRSSEALLAVPGIGPVKLERYGAALLEVVGAHTG
jgi:ATP-dependent DNA helicase RecQ